MTTSVSFTVPAAPSPEVVATSRRVPRSETAFQADTLGAMSALESDYEAAGFGRRLGWGEHPAVVAIDLCQAYVTPGSPLYAGCEPAVAAASEVIAAARAAGVPVLHTRVRYAPGG